MTAQFQFVMRTGPTPGKVFPLEGPEIIIGRDNTCSMMINDTEVSRKHARLVWQSLGYVLEDLGSTNGTFFNGQQVNAPLILRGGESISLGENIVIVYESAADPNATVLSTSANAIKEAIAAAQAKAEEPKPVVTSAPSQPVSTPAKAPPSRPVPISPKLVQPKAPKKSKKTWIILLVLILGLLCVCGVIVILLWNADTSFYCNTFPFNLYYNPVNFNCSP